MLHGRFIAFEGIDGSGKTTALEHVAAALRKERVALATTREESSTWRGEAVRRSIAEHGDALATTLLFVADRAQHVVAVKADLAAGRHVLCDRFVHSTYAYQTVTLRGRVADPRAFLAHLHEGWCPMPDHVLLFDADPAKALERVRQRGETTPYEKVEFLRDVQKTYLAEAKRDKSIQVIDAERPMAELAADALAIVRRWLA